MRRNGKKQFLYQTGKCGKEKLKLYKLKDDFSKAFKNEINNTTEFIPILLKLLLIIFTLQFVCQKSLLQF